MKTSFIQFLNITFRSNNIHYWIGLYHSNNGCFGCHTPGTFSGACTGETSGNRCCNCRFDWQWKDGSAMGFINWMQNEPTGQGNPCGRISRATPDHPITEGLFWFDFACTTESRFICKRRIQGRYVKSHFTSYSRYSNIPNNYAYFISITQ